MRKHSIVTFVWSGIRNMIRLIVKYDVQCCLFPFFVAVFLFHFLYSYLYFCHRLFPFFCFQENENEDGSEDEIGGRGWDGFEFNTMSTVGNFLLLVVVVVVVFVVVVRIHADSLKSCRRGAMASRCQGRDGFYLHLELLALRWSKQKRLFPSPCVGLLHVTRYSLSLD